MEGAAAARFVRDSAALRGEPEKYPLLARDLADAASHFKQEGPEPVATPNAKRVKGLALAVGDSEEDDSEEDLPPAQVRRQKAQAATRPATPPPRRQSPAQRPRALNSASASLASSGSGRAPRSDAACPGVPAAPALSASVVEKAEKIVEVAEETMSVAAKTLEAFGTALDEKHINEVKLVSVSASLKESAEKLTRAKQWDLHDKCAGMQLDFAAILSATRCLKAWHTGRTAKSDAAALALTGAFSKLEDRSHIKSPLCLRFAVLVSVEMHARLRKCEWTAAGSSIAFRVLSSAFEGAGPGSIG